MLKHKNIKDFWFFSFHALLLFISLVTFQHNAFAEIKTDTAEELRDLGYLEQQKGNYSEALNHFNKAISLGLESAIIFNDMGILYEQIGLPFKADQFYHKAIEKDQGYLPAYMNLAYLYLHNGQQEQALEYFRKRFERGDPEDPWTQRAKEEILNIEPRYQDVLTQSSIQKLNDDIIKQTQDDFYDQIKRTNEHYNRAEELAAKGELDKAVEEMKSALRITPSNPKVIKGLSRVYVQQGQLELTNGDYKSAYAHFTRALELTPDDASIIEAQGQAKLQSAKEHIKSGTSRALLFLDAGDTFSSEMELKRLLETFRDEPLVREKTVVDTYEKKSQQAYAEFQDRVQGALAHYEKGMAFAKDNRYHEAVEQYDRALELTPNNPRIMEAKQQAKIKLVEGKIQQHSQNALSVLTSGDIASAKGEIKELLNNLPSEVEVEKYEKDEKLQDWEQEAQSEFDKRVSKSVEHYQNGVKLQEEAKYEHAILEYDRALQFSPNNPTILEAREKAQLEKAKIDLKKRSEEAMQLLESGDTMSAKYEIQKILATIPSEPLLNSK